MSSLRYSSTVGSVALQIDRRFLARLTAFTEEMVDMTHL